MAHRIFSDRDGVLWEVWDVYPGWADRRQGMERRELSRAHGADRRAQLGQRIGVRAELASGWLCFRGAGEKRRLAPIPTDWDGLDDAQLALMVSTLPSMPDQSRRL